MVLFPPTVIVGVGFTLSTMTSLDAPQEPVAVTEYVVVIVGLAIGFGQVVQLNPVDGDHKNVPLPLGTIVVLPPLQMVRSGPAFTEGKAG